MKGIVFVVFALLFSVMPVAAGADVDNSARGVTVQDVGGDLISAGFDPARELPRPAMVAAPGAMPGVMKPFAVDEWVPLDSICTFVRIPAGERFVLEMTPRAGRIEALRPDVELNDYVMEAVARAPRWLRADLVSNLTAISGDEAEFWTELLAGLILDAEDPYVDEIAFAAAHVSSGLLGSGTLNFDLFVENAQTIYESDEYLDYVSIIDHGGAGDDDFWSTLQYNIRRERVAGEDSVVIDTVQVEIDPYYYYWFVAHPRLSDEHPLYINPATGGSQGPPSGVFWRDFLLNHPDEGYPSLREVLEGCGVLWSGLRNDGSEENGAVGLVNQWIRTVLVFDAGNERPIQPVRIYRLHMGRCGEHEDMTAAAGRAALIPTTGVAVWPNDHVWNEFYDGRWVQWEPVNNYVDDSLAYERWNEGNWRAPALFRWRGDGFVETVTGRYQSRTADLVVTISDRNRRPVDGAKVMLASEYLYGGLSIATWGFTNSAGEVAFKIGENRNIYLRVDSQVGSYPAQNVVQVVTNSRPDRVYEWSRQMDGALERLRYHEADPVDEPLNHFHLAVSYQPLVETVTGRIFDYSDFLAGIYPARINFFICDHENYQIYQDGGIFAAYNIGELTEEGAAEFSLPTDGQWYAVFSGDQRAVSFEDLNLDAYWFMDSEWGAPEADGSQPAEYRLAQNSPNPFNSSTWIAFSLAGAEEVELQVLDLQGRLVASLPLGELPAGEHRVRLDAGSLESGVYIYHLRTGGFQAARKMVILR